MRSLASKMNCDKSIITSEITLLAQLFVCTVNLCKRQLAEISAKITPKIRLFRQFLYDIFAIFPLILVLTQKKYERNFYEGNMKLLFMLLTEANMMVTIFQASTVESQKRRKLCKWIWISIQIDSAVVQPNALGENDVKTWDSSHIVIEIENGFTYIAHLQRSVCIIIILWHMAIHKKNDRYLRKFVSWKMWKKERKNNEENKRMRI